MADTKISALPASTTPLAGTEVLPIVQSSSTVQVSVANLTAGRAVATGALTVTGLVDISAATSGQIKFPATQNASTDANTLDDYEEGTWTPAPNSGTFSSATGTYTKVGRLVTLTFDIIVGTAGGTTMTNPFTAAISTASSIYTSGQTYGVGTTYANLVVGGGSVTMYLRTSGSAVSFAAMTLTASAAINGVVQFTV